MTNIVDRLKNIFRVKTKVGAAELQNAFRKHYRHFRALLTANNNALDIMAEMEQALEPGKPFGMAFVRGNCTALSVNVYKMINHLLKLSDGKYKELKPPFKSITDRIEQILSRQPTLAEGKLILSMDEIDKNSVDQVGEKMAHLGELRNRLGVKTPEGFVITATAAQYFIDQSNLQEEINRQLQTLDLDDLEALYRTSAAIQKLISSAPLPQELQDQISDQYRLLAEKKGAEVLVSLRSSALGEDSMNVSFAGQYRTQLNVSPEFLSETYKEIVAGKYKSQAIIYRQQRGYRHQDVIMCVGCLAMVDAAVSGVTYSRSPDNPRSSWVVIQAAPGLASNVVDGSSASEMFHVDREHPNKVITRKKDEGRIEKESITGPSLALTDAQAGELARIAIKIEDHFGAPQDIEWSIDRTGEIYILQSRPISEFSRPLPGLEKEGDEVDTGNLPSALLAGGVPACRGVACGPVFKVRSNLDLLQFPKNAVLMVESPLPDWAVLLSRTAAVVSDSGHIAAHLATVAREFGVPAIFGLDNAYASLNNGDIVTVDATARRIYRGRVESLLSEPASKPDLMADSPVYRILKETLSLISPLNLTNPASPFFRPSSCQTLHDITRFCHEKAVVEMFHFGQRYGFDDKAAKRLVFESPSQWWVIDLDDGFKEGVDPESKFVSIEDIVSEPMLAIWRGMTAFPWPGPPPVSLKGFGSIVFQSTMNPHLDPAVRSAMAAKNYFLISKNFCNLSVRLGYHLSLVEANLSDLLTESYVSFQFKGGAADEHRRCRRVNILREMLAQLDFRVEQKADALTARLEKRPSQYLKERLMVLGYLLIHTRQIDMIMEDEEAVERLVSKIGSDIETLLNKRIE